MYYLNLFAGNPSTDEDITGGALVVQQMLKEKGCAPKSILTVQVSSKQEPPCQTLQ